MKISSFASTAIAVLQTLSTPREMWNRLTSAITNTCKHIYVVGKLGPALGNYEYYQKLENRIYDALDNLYGKDKWNETHIENLPEKIQTYLEHPDTSLEELFKITIFDARGISLLEEYAQQSKQSRDLGQSLDYLAQWHLKELSDAFEGMIERAERKAALLIAEEERIGREAALLATKEKIADSKEDSSLKIEMV